MTELSPGTRVQYVDGRAAVVRYSGTTHFSTGHWIGIELEDDSGKNDGSVKGQRYFTCPVGHGMFVRPDTISRIGEESCPPTEQPAAAKSFNGIERRSRQSIMSAEAARKRQSLMGSGPSRSAPGSRTSLRSPTKSPPKLGPSQRNSSGHSSSRTSSPSTTARTSNSSAKSRLSVSSRPSMGPPPIPGTKASTRSSLVGASGRIQNTDSAARSSRTAARPSMMLTIDRSNLLASREQSRARSMAGEETSLSPSVVAEGHEEERLPTLSRDSNMDVDSDREIAASRTSPPPAQMKNDEGSMLVNGMSDYQRDAKTGSAATDKELEQMRAKYAVMERKRMEDRDKLKAAVILREERDKFESTMQKLQRKCQAQSQEISDWRRQLQESEAKMEEIERADAERGTEMEMAALDKEMAEERLEAVTDELEKLQGRFEELQLDSEIVRDENKELTSGMTSAERSSAGWVQMEKENQRLRDALVALRDMTHETEAGLKSHLKELEQDLSEVEGLKGEHERAKSDLATARNTIQTLKENLDAAENQELLVSDLTETKDALAERVESLSRELEMLKVEVEYHQDMRRDAEETERLLQDDLDAVQLLARQRHQEILNKEQTIADRDRTLSKFEGAVRSLQQELWDLRVSQQLNEAETKELNTTSRDMMDLNRRLRDSAAQTRAKTVEFELTRIRAEDVALHFSILEHFVMDSFRNESAQVLALLRFKRIASKADLLRTAIESETTSSRSSPQDQIFISFDMMEKLQWIALCCSRSYNFMKGCTVEDFSKSSLALSELEPVERSLDAFVSAVRHSDLDSGRWIEDFQRLLPLLSDLAEKIVPSTPAAFAETVTGRLRMTQLSSNLSALQLGLIKDFMLSKVVQTEQDHGPLQFSQEADKLVDRCRMAAVIAGKVLGRVEESRNRSMTLREKASEMFERIESIGADLSKFTRVIGQRLVKLLDEDASGSEKCTVIEVSTILQASTKDWAEESNNELSETADAFALISGLLSRLHSNLDSISHLVSNLSSFSEFERHPAPWIVRAKALAEQKMVDPETEDQLRKAQHAAHEQTVAINLKEQEVEEQSLKIELLEARSKGLKENAAALQTLERELVDLAAQRDRAVAQLENVTQDKAELSQKHDEARAKLAAIDQDGTERDRGAPGSLDCHTSLQLSTHIESMREEISSLQSAVRYLKAENHRLLHPTAVSLAATNHAWLAANPLRIGKAERGKCDDFTFTSASATAVEANDIFNTLREVTSTLKPIRLQPPPVPVSVSVSSASAAPSGDGVHDAKPTSWRPIKKTPRYIVSRQREELESWIQWKHDLLRRSLVHKPHRPHQQRRQDLHGA